MLQHFLDSGAYNSTFWFVLLAAMALALRWRLRGNGLVYGAALFLLIVGTAGNLFVTFYRAYTVPGDIVQDIVSAQEFLEGRPLYPDDMTVRINKALEREGPRGTLLDLWPSKREREKEKLQAMLTERWVQAHPPFMTLFTAAFVRQFGILGTQIAFELIALAALALTLHLIRLELFPQVNGRTAAMIGIALLGWDPVLGVLRRGQSGLLLAGLLTLSWFQMRRGRSGLAGIPAGVAISLKLVPGIILLVLILRHRRAFLSAMLTICAIGVTVVGLTSIQDHIDYYRTSQAVMADYANHPGNFSLLGALTHGIGDSSISLPLARSLWLVCAILIARAFAGQIGRRSIPSNETAETDLHFALAMTLMPLLSPVSWEHYLTFLILPLSVLGAQVISKGNQRTLLTFMGLLLFFSVPDATFYWLMSVCSQAGVGGLGNWLVQDLRTIGLGILAVWLARQARPTKGTVRETSSGEPASRT